MPGKAPSHAFSVDTSNQPAGHPPLSPADGAVAVQNPPSMIWRVDERAVTYSLEMCQNPAFDREVVRIEGIDMPFYNHSETLTEGVWYWRYTVVTPQSEKAWNYSFDMRPTKRPT